MDIVLIAIKVIIAAAIFNVWVLRYGKESKWRGGNAKNMKEEFNVYGLPEWMMALTGFLKVFLALILIASIWMPTLTQFGAIGIAVLMLGAIIMHIKVNDSLQKSLPAFSLLVLSSALLIIK